MGWNLLRREAVALALCALGAARVGAAGAPSGVPAGVPAGAPAGVPAGAPSGPLPARAPLGVPADALPGSVLAGEDALHIPPAQTHRGPEVYSLDFPDEDVIDRYVEGLLAGRWEWLQAVLERSRLYVGFIAAEIEARGLPRELAYLPAVESGFQARAVSRKGATGLWQLMGNTASPYGLRMDQWVDERRDFWRATEAALAKLEENQRRFGDWALALAAYNCGTGKLSRIVRQNPDRDYWSLRRKGVLPRETAAFVPQFMALARILSHPGRYGLEVGWQPSPQWARVPVEGSVDIRILARESGVPAEALTQANPELNFPMTPPKSYGYMLKVPAEHRRAIEATLAAAAAPLLDFAIHVVKSGDTLSEIAQAFGVSVEMILQFNPSVRPLALRIGSRIFVPRTGPRTGGRRTG